MEFRKKYSSLDEIMEDDDFHLIEIIKKPSNTGVKSEELRLIESFQEINDFYEKNKREPEEGTDFSETQLAYRLSGLRSNEVKKETLKPFDIYDLLQKKIEFSNLDEILENDDLGLFNVESEGLFDFKHTPKVDDRAGADFVARRTPCNNFDDYEPVFKQVQNDLSKGARKLLEFHEGMLQERNFYISNGILLFFEDFQQEKREHIRGSSKDRKDGRTRVIFENGTESNMLFRSLYKALLANGYAVSEHVDKVQEKLDKSLGNVSEEDKESGFIYIAKSLSNKPEIRAIKDLYKIGFSMGSVEERVKNASQDPTYLMAGVKIISAFQCYNMNSQKFEQLLHNFFGKACLNIDVYDQKGKRHVPQEWFIAPLNVIERAIHMIINGEIMNYRFDVNTGNITLK